MQSKEKEVRNCTCQAGRTLSTAVLECLQMDQRQGGDVWVAAGCIACAWPSCRVDDAAVIVEVNFRTLATYWQLHSSPGGLEDYKDDEPGGSGLRRRRCGLE